MNGVLANPTDAANETDELAQWHGAARKAFEQAISRDGVPEIIRTSNEQLTYSIARSDGQRLDPAQLIEIATRANFEIRDRVNTGWSLFYPFTRAPIAAFLNTDQSSGQQGREFLESDLLRDDGIIEADADLWRISSDGKATALRPYRADFWKGLPARFESGRWFSPNTLARELGEVVRHAQAMTERFDAPETVHFICEWRGLRQGSG